MHDVIAESRECLVNEVRMQRRLPVVDAPLRQNADEIVSVQINWIRVGRRDVIPEPSQHPPWTNSEKFLPARGAECCLEARIVHDPGGGQNLLGVGGPNDAEFGLAVHRPLSPDPARCYAASWQNVR